MSEIIDQLRSLHLHNQRPIWVRPPADPATATRLVVLLDAELYRDRVGAGAIIEGLRARGEVADAWFVFVSMASEEARWVECPCHPPFARFVVDELLPWLTERHPGIARVRQRVLVGLSYTGLAAAFVAISRPGVFQTVISQSGSFWWNDAWLTQEVRRTRLQVPTGFYLDVGSRERQENVRHRPDVLQVMSQIDGVRGFRDALVELGHRVNYVEYDGGHDFAAWQRMLPGALRWAVPPDKT